MTTVELGQILRDMYNNAPEKETATMVHLFGVKYADEIKECDGSPADVAKAAGISENYGTEINKAINLAKYVQVKPEVAML